MLWSGYVFSLMLADADIQFNYTSNKNNGLKISLKSNSILKKGIPLFGSYVLYICICIWIYIYIYIFVYMWSSLVIFYLLNLCITLFKIILHRFCVFRSGLFSSLCHIKCGKYSVGYVLDMCETYCMGALRGIFHNTLRGTYFVGTLREISHNILLRNIAWDILRLTAWNILRGKILWDIPQHTAWDTLPGKIAWDIPPRTAWDSHAVSSSHQSSAVH